MTPGAPRRPSVLLPAVLLSSAAAVLGLTSCRGPADEAPDESARSDDTPLTGEILVSAAASLTDAFGDLASAFQAAHTQVEVTLNLAGTAALRAQILEGAPVDVFAAADRANMQRVVASGEATTTPRIFARNRLALVVPAGNPAGVGGLADFARDELFLGLCAPEVPCGIFARQALERAGVQAAVDTGEPDARALLTKVALGELDAAIVYETDIAAAGGAVQAVEIPDDQNVVTEYPIAVLARTGNPRAARAFVDFVVSPEGQRILRHHGFGSP